MGVLSIALFFSFPKKLDVVFLFLLHTMQWYYQMIFILYTRN